MNKIISRYGTFLIIPPVLIIIAFVAFKFNVTTKAEVILIQHTPTEIIAYIPNNVAVSDTLHVDSPEYGSLTLPIAYISKEPSNQRVVCTGNLPADDTILHAYIITETQPLYQVLLHR